MTPRGGDGSSSCLSYEGSDVAYLEVSDPWEYTSGFYEGEGNQFSPRHGSPDIELLTDEYCSGLAGRDILVIRRNEGVGGSYAHGREYVYNGSSYPNSLTSSPRQLYSNYTESVALDSDSAGSRNGTSSSDVDHGVAPHPPSDGGERILSRRQFHRANFIPARYPARMHEDKFSKAKKVFRLPASLNPKSRYGKEARVQSAKGDGKRPQRREWKTMPKYPPRARHAETECHILRLVDTLHIGCQAEPEMTGAGVQCVAQMADASSQYPKVKRRDTATQNTKQTCDVSCQTTPDVRHQMTETSVRILYQSEVNTRHNWTQWEPPTDGEGAELTDKYLEKVEPTSQIVELGSEYSKKEEPESIYCSERVEPNSSNYSGTQPRKDSSKYDNVESHKEVEPRDTESDDSAWSQSEEEESASTLSEGAEPGSEGARHESKGAWPESEEAEPQSERAWPESTSQSGRGKPVSKRNYEGSAPQHTEGALPEAMPHTDEVCLTSVTENLTPKTCDAEIQCTRPTPRVLAPPTISITPPVTEEDLYEDSFTDTDSDYNG